MRVWHIVEDRGEGEWSDFRRQHTPDHRFHGYVIAENREMAVSFYRANLNLEPDVSFDVLPLPGSETLHLCWSDEIDDEFNEGEFCREWEDGVTKSCSEWVKLGPGMLGVNGMFHPFGQGAPSRYAWTRSRVS
jgi:hypothetical protein